MDEWTTELPTQPGWYWVWNGKNIPFVVELEISDGVLSWEPYYDMGPSTNIAAIAAYWIGPLPVPEPPRPT